MFKLMKITSVIITGEYEEQKTLISFEKLKEIVQKWMSGLVCSVMFGSFRSLFLRGTNTNSNDLS